MNNPLYNIQDNVLAERDMNDILNNFLFNMDQKEGIHNFVNAKSVPWHVVKHNSNSIHFSHLAYDQQTIASKWFNILGPVLCVLNPKSLVRIKANLFPKTTNIEEHGYHVDFPFECSTSIFYLNTNNGYTKFEDGTVVESISNRLLTFSTLCKHTSSSCTDVEARVNINFNYF